MSYLATRSSESVPVTGNASAFALTGDLTPDLDIELVSEDFQATLNTTGFVDETEMGIPLATVNESLAEDGGSVNAGTSVSPKDASLRSEETVGSSEIAEPEEQLDPPEMPAGSVMTVNLPDLHDEAALEAAADALLAGTSELESDVAGDVDYDFDVQDDDPVMIISDSGAEPHQGEFLPTDEPPGSPGKIEVLRYRYHCGLPLWHEHDRKDFSGLGLLAYLQRDDDDDDGMRNNITTLESAGGIEDYDDPEPLARPKREVKPRAGGQHRGKKSAPAKAESEKETASSPESTQTGIATQSEPAEQNGADSTVIVAGTETEPSAHLATSNESAVTAVSSVDTDSLENCDIVSEPTVSEAPAVETVSGPDADSAQLSSDISLSEATLPALSVAALTEEKSSETPAAPVDKAIVATAETPSAQIEQSGTPETVPTSDKSDTGSVSRSSSARKVAEPSRTVTAKSYAATSSKSNIWGRSYSSDRPVPERQVSPTPLATIATGLTPDARRAYEAIRTCVANGMMLQSDLDSFRREHKITPEMDLEMFGPGK